MNNKKIEPIVSEDELTDMFGEGGKEEVKEFYNQPQESKEKIPCSCPKGGEYDDGTICDKCDGTEYVYPNKPQPPTDEGWEIDIQSDLDRGVFGMICSNEQTFKDYVYPIFRKIRREAIEETEKDNYWKPCIGCSDGHSSFWKTVIESPQWKEWEKEISHRVSEHIKNNSEIYEGCWDIDECQECGWISQGHFQDFIKFVKRQTAKEILDEVEKGIKVKDSTINPLQIIDLIQTLREKYL